MRPRHRAAERRRFHDCIFIVRQGAVDYRTKLYNGRRERGGTTFINLENSRTLADKHDWIQQAFRRTPFYGTA
jgi:hypothetical protein